MLQFRPTIVEGTNKVREDKSSDVWHVDLSKPQHKKVSTRMSRHPNLGQVPHKPEVVESASSSVSHSCKSLDRIPASLLSRLRECIGMCVLRPFCRELREVCGNGCHEFFLIRHFDFCANSKVIKLGDTLILQQRTWPDNNSIDSATTDQSCNSLRLVSVERPIGEQEAEPESETLIDQSVNHPSHCTKKDTQTVHDDAQRLYTLHPMLQDFSPPVLIPELTRLECACCECGMCSFLLQRAMHALKNNVFVVGNGDLLHEFHSPRLPKKGGIFTSPPHWVAHKKERYLAAQSKIASP